MLPCPAAACARTWASEQTLAAHLIDAHEVAAPVAAVQARAMTVQARTIRRVPTMPTPTTTGGHHVCSYCKRRDDEPHGPGCKNPKAEGNRGPAKKASAPRRVELRVSRGGNSIATDLRAVPTPELVAALERGLNELARRLAVLDQVREVIG